MSERQTVAVVIPTLNVAAFFRPTLESIRWADQVIVVDMFSTDETLALCAQYPNVTVYQNKDYIFANVNFGFDRATTDWVIRLDSDEVIEEELQKSILAFLKAPDPKVNTVLFRGLHYMFGYPMHHGVGAPERSWRRHMFRRGTARYPCVHEHEDIASQGDEARIDGFYSHYTNHTVDEVVRKFNYYTQRDVERVADADLRPLPPWRLLWRSMRLFVLYYFQWKGYKDGMVGFYTSLYRGPIYQFIEQAKRWEASQKRGSGQGKS